MRLRYSLRFNFPSTSTTFCILQPRTKQHPSSSSKTNKKKTPHLEHLANHTLRVTAIAGTSSSKSECVIIDHSNRRISALVNVTFTSGTRIIHIETIVIAIAGIDTIHFRQEIQCRDYATTAVLCIAGDSVCAPARTLALDCRAAYRSVPRCDGGCDEWCWCSACCNHRCDGR